jgi:hypothetical protein
MSITFGEGRYLLGDTVVDVPVHLQSLLLAEFLFNLKAVGKSVARCLKEDESRLPARLGAVTACRFWYGLALNANDVAGADAINYGFECVEFPHYGFIVTVILWEGEEHSRIIPCVCITMSWHVGVDAFVNQNMELPHEVRSLTISGGDHFADIDQIEVRHNAI